MPEISNPCSLPNVNSFSNQPAALLNDGYKIPYLGLGTFECSNEEAQASVEAALENGYRHVDTAAIYQNEAGVGKGIKQIKRADVFLTSKLWNDMQAGSKPKEALSRTLEQLNTDYLDLYLIHWPCPRLGTFINAWTELIEAQQAGLVKSIGVSNFLPEHLQELIAQTNVIPAINQIEHHPTLQQVEIKNFCAQNNIVVEAYAPLGRALGNDLTSEITTKIAKETNRTNAQVLLRWGIQQGLVVIPKSVHSERVAANAKIFDFALTASQIESLNSLESGYRTCPNPAEFHAPFEI